MAVWVFSCCNSSVRSRPKAWRLVQARHLVPGRLVVQLGDLAMGVEFGALIEGGEQLAQCRLCLYAVQHGGIPLLQRLQPAAAPACTVPRRTLR